MRGIKNREVTVNQKLKVRLQTKRLFLNYAQRLLCEFGPPFCIKFAMINSEHFLGIVGFVAKPQIS